MALLRHFVTLIMKNNLQIHDIKKFELVNNEVDFYNNFLSKHIKNYHFTNFPHKHDFF